MGTETSYQYENHKCLSNQACNKKVIPNMGTEHGTKLKFVVSSPMSKQCTAFFTSHNTGSDMRNTQ